MINARNNLQDELETLRAKSASFEDEKVGFGFTCLLFKNATRVLQYQFYEISYHKNRQSQFLNEDDGQGTYCIFI